MLAEQGLCPGAVVGKEVKRVKKVKEEMDVQVEREIKAQDVGEQGIPDVEDFRIRQAMREAYSP